MNKSLLELLVRPLMLFKIIRESWQHEPRQLYIYEHVYTGVFISAFCFMVGGFGIPIYILGLLFHIFVKEFVVDQHKHGYINWPNVIERVYGFVLGLIFAPICF